MIKVNRTLFDLTTVYKTMTHAEVWELTGSLKITRHELINALRAVNDKVLFEGHLKAERMALVEQLSYLSKNIKTLEEVLMCFETKIFDKRPSLGDLQIFGLN